MENFNKGFDSSPSIKGGNKSNNENELNPEMSSKLKSPKNKQLPSKNFMNPTISAAIKASVPRKRILGERNETLDTVEQPRLQRSASFGSRSVKSPVINSVCDTEKDLVSDPCLQPYDPIINYLSPRPKFLRYNPDRRRKKILVLQENDADRIKISTYFDAGRGIPSSDLQLGFSDSCSQQESIEEAQDVNNEKDEDDDECEDDDDEEMIEFREDSCCSLRGFLKFLFVVIAVILTTQAICLMNSPSVSQTLESVCSVNDWRDNVYALNNFSEVGYGPIREPDLLVGELREGDAYDHSYYSLDMFETHEEFVVVQDAKTDDDYVHQDEVENDDDSNVIHDEILLEQDAKTDDYVHQDDVEIDDDSIVIQEEILQEQDYVEAETVQDGLAEEDDSNANELNPQLTFEVESEVVNEIEDVEEKEFDDIKTNDVLIKVTSFDPIIAVLVGHLLILTSFSVIYCSKAKKSSASVTTPVQKQEFKDLEPSKNPKSMTQQKEELATPQQKDVSKLHIPSVELIGEFVFGEEITSNVSTEDHSTNSLIQTTADSFSQTKSSQIEMSTGDPHTAKKQRRKNAEVVSPSPVRRSSRLKTRSIMSP